LLADYFYNSFSNNKLKLKIVSDFSGLSAIIISIAVIYTLDSMASDLAFPHLLLKGIARALMLSWARDLIK
jgi:hypothetical protein